ncbi:MAG: glycosyltransferase family 4 protein, partial [Candidatus Sumerlaeia bacterium]|nr:glycosyltransferase family 4 protein [Candidatus Sumerlaeia bacterium]
IVERVKFLGMQPHESIAGMMMRSQVGVVPLPLSGFPEARLFCCPLKALELMAAGTPIVASDLHAVRGLLKHSENAWLVKPDDAKALATGISEVLENQELRNRLIAGGLQSAQELSYDARARKILEFARSVW